MAATGIGRKMEDLSAGTESEILAAVKYLLELGVDIDAVNRTGETAMHGAAYKNLPKVVGLSRRARRQTPRFGTNATSADQRLI